MLVLNRSVGEGIWIGEDIHVSVEKVRGGSVVIGIVAPQHVKVLRDELERDREKPAPADKEVSLG